MRCEYSGGPSVRFMFEAVGAIATANAFPEVTCGERSDMFKLPNVGNLVQEQRDIEFGCWREKDRATNGNSQNRITSQGPTADARREPTSAPTCRREYWMTLDQRDGQRHGLADNGQDQATPSSSQ